MTTITPYVQRPNVLFTFNPTLDGQIYIATVSWNVFGRRLYLNLYATDGTIIFTLPLIGSPTGVLMQSTSYSNGRINVTTVSRHGYKVGDTIRLTIAGTTPDAYNGTVNALITGPFTFSYPAPAPLGPPSVLGVVNYNVNLAGGYFTTSTLVFREANQNFEVTP